MAIDITIKVESVSQLLSDVAAAYMQNSCPSAILTRVAGAVIKPRGDERDDAFNALVAKWIDELRERVRRAEDRHYGNGTPLELL